MTFPATITMMSPLSTAFIAPVQINMQRSAIFKDVENVNYLAYWLKKEMGFECSITFLDPILHKNLLESVFPEGQKGKVGILVEFENGAGIHFLKQTQPSMKSVYFFEERME